jgi:hypothetical protein
VQRGGEVKANFEQNWLPAITATLLAGAVVILTFGWATPESELPNPEIVRDAVIDYRVVETALGADIDTVSHIPRPPGAIAWLLPQHLAPVEYSTWAAALITVVSIGALMRAVVRLTPDRHIAHMVTALVLPVSLIFAQTVYHGNAFFLLAAVIVWGWVFLEEGKDIPAGVLIGLAGAARLWPMLLVFVAVKYHRTKTVIAAAAGFVGLTGIGLALPGVTVQSSIAALTEGGSHWVAAPSNGSLAAVLHGQIPTVGAVLIVLAVWVAGLVFVPDMRTAIGWTVAAAVFASPLAWIGYLAVLVPLAQRAGMVTGSALVVIQVVGHRVFSHREVFLATLLLVVWLLVRHIGIPQPTNPPGGAISNTSTDIRDMRASPSDWTTTSTVSRVTRADPSFCNADSTDSRVTCMSVISYP